VELIAHWCVLFKLLEIAVGACWWYASGIMAQGGSRSTGKSTVGGTRGGPHPDDGTAEDEAVT
jgi:hypothetical protein